MERAFRRGALSGWSRGSATRVASAPRSIQRITVLRIAFKSLGALVFGGLAVATYEVYQAAVRNSASPGAIILLPLAGFFALIALLAALAVVIELVLRSKRRTA